MKSTKQKLLNFFTTVSPRLIIFNLIWWILGVFADWHWLTAVNPYLIPLTPICSVYPLSLAISQFIIFKNYKPPALLLYFTFIGTFSYGILAQIYFPLLMFWKGLNFHDLASMFWVAAYGIQSIIIYNKLSKLNIFSLILTVFYFLLKNYSDVHWQTFLDFNLPNYPNWLKTTIIIFTILTQFISISLILKHKLNKST